jgi:hypothetical protein
MSAVGGSAEPVLGGHMIPWHVFTGAVERAEGEHRAHMPVVSRFLEQN